MNSFTSQIAANNIGAYEIGVLVSYVLFGVTTTQTYTYYSRFTDNSRKLKGLVALVWVCELGHALCVARALYFYTTADCMHPNILNQSPWALDMAFVIVALIVACVQAFFGFRIYMLSKRLYIPVVIWIAALLRLAGGIATPLWALQGLVVRARLLMVSTWNVGVANDLLMTATLVVLLRRQRADVHKRTVALADKIIAWSIETAMMTSAVAIAELICFLMMPKNWTWIAISTIEARMFANSFLASLNGRTTLRAIGDAPLTFVIPTIQSFSNGVEIANVRPNASDAELNTGLENKEASSGVYRVQVESEIE
ncbi:hypothetical protein B0H14DRAFT_1636925 [Mycena olivaceomarginata]|nr:hypothetical protein B0H14DRAFT_1636925 [Mycena olivaceomarginata]